MDLLRVTIELEWVDTETRGWELRALGPDGQVENSMGYATLIEALAHVGGAARVLVEQQIEHYVRS